MWAGQDRVYVIGSDANGPALYFNGGTGWNKTSTQPESLQSWPDALTGIPPGGPLVLYGGTCVFLFDGLSETCAGAITAYPVFAVDAQHVYAIAGTDRVISYNGTYFTQYGSFPPNEDGAGIYRLWASADVVVVAGAAGKVYVFDGAGTNPQTLVIPDGKDAWSLWGFARNDLWVGSTDGRLAHYDGASWSIVQRAEGSCSTVREMWGADGILFYATSSTVGRWKAGQFDTILDAPCSSRDDTAPGVFEEVSVQGLWGTSPNEMFIVLREWKAVVSATSDGLRIDTIAADACGSFRLYWFDGQRLGPL